MPDSKFSFRDALVASAKAAQIELTSDADAYLTEAAGVLATMSAEFLASGTGDPAYVAAHVRARLEQLLALHMMTAEAQVKRDLLNLGLAILHGAIAVGAA